MTRQEQIDLANEARRLLIKKFPPETFGEDSDCDIIDQALQELASDGDLASV